MERGLLWLPLLGLFIGLAWAGWNEYQKVQAYETWAAKFDRSKYDIQAVLGQFDNSLTWGKPTRRGPADLTSVSLTDVDAVGLKIKGQMVAAEMVPSSGESADIVLTLQNGEVYSVPFTDAALAYQWKKALHQSLQALKSAST